MTALAIDLGFEFVDVAIHSRSDYRIRKIPVRGQKSAAAILAAVDTSLAAWSVPIEAVDSLRICSTDAVNALLARNGARVALLMTQGFGDCLWLARQNRADLYDPVARSPAPAFLVDRENTFEIGGRLDAKGKELTPLDETAIRAAAEAMREGGIEAIAVCFLFSYVEPTHERRCRDIVRETLPHCEVCLSHEVDPQPREYERTVSVCLEAWLRPPMLRAMTALREGLLQRGFRGRLFYGDGRGTILDEETARLRVSRLLTSGPAASARYAASAAGTINVPTAIAIDIGSRSADVALIRNGELQSCRHTVYAGVPLRQDMVDVVSFGLGGSSKPGHDGHGQIAFDAGSRDRLPDLTLSDTLAYLGRIPSVLGAGMEDALLTLGKAIGKEDAHMTAIDVVEAAEREIAACVLDFAVRRNIDPSTTPLIAMGGLGGILGPGIAAVLGTKRVALPDASSTAGALGLVVSGIRFDANATIGAWTDAIADTELQAALAALTHTAREQSAKIGWNGASVLQVTAEMAATPHMHSYQVTLAELPQDAGALAAAFKEQYFAEFGDRIAGKIYVFSLNLHLAGGGKPAPVGLCARIDNSIRGDSDAALLQTAAGSIWKPEGWSLTRTGSAYILRSETNR